MGRQLVVHGDFANDTLRELVSTYWGVSYAVATHALCFEMRASQTMMVFVEVHHLKAIELVGDLLDLFFLAWLLDLHPLGVPVQCCQSTTA